MWEHFITLIGASDYSFLEHFYIIILQLHQLDSIASQPVSPSIARISSQSASLSASQPACLPASQPACLPAFQPASLPASHPTCQPASQPLPATSQPASVSQPASLPASLPASQPACLPIHIGLNIHCTLYWTFIELLDLYSIGYCISGTFIMTDRSVWVTYPCLNLNWIKSELLHRDKVG